MTSFPRNLLSAATVLLAWCGADAGAQTVQPRLPPALPSPQILPDLVVSQIQFEGGVFVGPCNRVGVTIANVGNSAVTAPVAVRLTTSIPATEATPASIDRQYGGGLSAGASATVFFDPYVLPADPTQLQIFVTAVVDPADEILELNGSNNLRTVEQAVLATRSACPALAVSGGSALEGSHVVFSVTVDRRFPRDVSVSYATAPGTAREGACTNGDYPARSGALRFPANTDPRPQQVSVGTCQDLSKEPDKGFSLRLSNPVNGTIARGTAAGSIRDRPAS